MHHHRVRAWSQCSQFGFDVGPRPVLELGVHVFGGEQPWAVEEVAAAPRPRPIRQCSSSTKKYSARTRVT